jgi:hypothetical protein
LHGRIDCNQADAGNDRTFIDEVAADDSAVKFGNNSVNVGMRYKLR